jgi:hypothetical protein
VCCTRTLDTISEVFRVPKMISKHKLPPTYVVHTERDMAVAVEQADEVVEIMAGERLEVKYERLHGGEGHLFDYDGRVELEGMYGFLMEHL